VSPRPLLFDASPCTSGLGWGSSLAATRTKGVQISNASDERRFDGHEKIKIVTVTIRLTLGSRKGRNTDGRLSGRSAKLLLPFGRECMRPRDFAAGLGTAAEWLVTAQRPAMPMSSEWISKMFAKIKATWPRLTLGRGTSEPDEPAIPAIKYKGYRIRPTPYGTNGQYQTAGIIEKDAPTA
jgi:hypothetical protein